jgi:AcrR family transcriptional regulator
MIESSPAIRDRGPWADDTRGRILDAAERLFAQRGIDAVSLREITRVADVNIAAIHYHYGSREGLVRAVLDRVVVPLNRMRIGLLDAARAGKPSGAIPVAALLDAFIRPDLLAIEALRDDGVWVARFLGRTYSQPTPLVEQIMREQFADVAARFIPELARSLPHVGPGEIAWRMTWCVVGVIVALFAQATPRGVPGPFDTGDVEGTLARVIAFVEPGLSAPAARKPEPSKRRRSR